MEIAFPGLPLCVVQHCATQHILPNVWLQREGGAKVEAEGRGFSEMSVSQSSSFSQLNNFEPIAFISLKYLSGLCNLWANKLKQKAIF